MATGRWRGVVLFTLFFLLACGLGKEALGQIQVTSQDGKSTLNLGFLSQLQLEELQNLDATHYQQNLFFRRLRIMAGGKVNENLSFFFDTDSPNLGKGQTSGSKVDSTIFIQDFFLTYSLGNKFKLDAGMLLVPVSHNSQQGATTFLAVDYGPYTFLHSDPLNSKVGRDYGLQARGYLAGDHFEYRLGILQGNRGTDSRSPFRTIARVVFYPFEADTGFFYTGTNLGKKRVWALGGSYDAQEDYRTYSGDVFIDQPVGGGDGVTFQFDFTRYDGGTTFTTLPKQDATLAELGYYFHTVKLSPFLQYGKRNFDDPARPDESKFQGGVAWWGNGHRFNVKLGAAVLRAEGAKDRHQYVVQWQVLTF
jgi:hypothetical protein